MSYGCVSKWSKLVYLPNGFLLTMDLERHPIFRQTLIYNFIQLDNFPLPGFMSSPAGWQEMSMIDFNHGDFFSSANLGRWLAPRSRTSGSSPTQSKCQIRFGDGQWVVIYMYILYIIYIYILYIYILNIYGYGSKPWHPRYNEQLVNGCSSPQKWE